MRTLVLVALGLFIGVTAFAEEAAPEVTVSKYGKVYTNADLTLEMVTRTGTKSILARITGAPAEADNIDGRVMDYDAINAGSGYDYVGRGKGGVSVHRIQSRPTMGDTIDVFCNRQTYTLKVDEKASKALETKKLLEDYKATRGKPGP